MDPGKSTHSTTGAASERRSAPNPHPPRQEKEHPQPPPNGVVAAPPALPNRTAQPAPHKQLTRSASIDHHPSKSRQTAQTPKPEPDPKKVIDELAATRIKELEETVRRLDSQITNLEHKCRHYESDAYRQEVLSIRVHLQVNDLIEPWEISQKFGEIIRGVEDISRNLGEILSRAQPISEPKTNDFLKFLPHRSHEATPQALPTQSFPVDPEEFIDFGCRALLNGTLSTSFLSPRTFHPALGPDENRLLSETYEKIRTQESQVIAGRWRISSLKAYGEGTYDFRDSAIRFCQNKLLAFCSHVYDPKTCAEACNVVLPSITALFERTVAWDSLAKLSVVMLDFHPGLFLPGSLYDAQATTLEGRRPKPPASKTILLTSKLGLWSSRAVGEQKQPEFTIQTKATVLAAEYFA